MRDQLGIGLGLADQRGHATPRPSFIKPVVDLAGIVKKVGNSRKRVEQALGRKK